MTQLSHIRATIQENNCKLNNVHVGLSPSLGVTTKVNLRANVFFLPVTCLQPFCFFFLFFCFFFRKTIKYEINLSSTKFSYKFTRKKKKKNQPQIWLPFNFVSTVLRINNYSIILQVSVSSINKTSCDVIYLKLSLKKQKYYNLMKSIFKFLITPISF